MKQQMDLIKLVEQFSNEDACHAYLEELRWPEGVRCLRCESDKIARLAKRKQYECSACGYQFSVRTGTVFHDSHLPLWKWFVATYLICESKKGISANQLKRTLGCAYKTAWYLCHRIRSAMTVDDAELLSGVVEVDETYLGGKQRYASGKRGGDGSWRERKTMVLGAVERGGQVRFRVADRADKKTLHKFVADVVADDAEAIYTDDAQAYTGIGDADTVHATVNHSANEWVRGQIHTNTAESMWSLFDRGVIGSYHKLSRKHLPAYLDEFAWRWNERGNPYLFRDTLMRLTQAQSLSYQELVAPRE